MLGSVSSRALVHASRSIPMTTSTGIYRLAEKNETAVDATELSVVCPLHLYFALFFLS